MVQTGGNMGTNENVSKRQKVGKIVSYTINIISVIIMIFSVFIVATYLSSQDRGYPVYFGKSYCVVQSDSMAADTSKKDNFEEGDVICFRVLNDEEKLHLRGIEKNDPEDPEKITYPGDVVTFWDYNIGVTKVLNTHRIYEVRNNPTTGEIEYSTKGDNNISYDRDQASQQLWRKASDMQGIYLGKAPGIGNFLIFIQSKTGFAVLVVVPCVLIMIYCATLVILNLIKYTKQKAVIQHEDNVEALREQMKAELLREMEEKRKQEEQDAANDSTEEEPKD